MRLASLLISLTVLLILVGSDCSAALPMRPYSGIGVLQITKGDLAEELLLYEEPGLTRNGTLETVAARQLTAWLFGAEDDLYLLVTARKGDWLRIERDNAGRQAWLHAMRRWHYSPWDQFLKGKAISFLRNAPKHQLQIYPHPGATNGNPLPAHSLMKVIKVQGDWSYVLFDLFNIGWIRWRDHDGRLLVGLSQSSAPQSR